MRAPRAAARRVAASPPLGLAPEDPPPAGSNTCGAQVEAMHRQADATERLARAGEALAFAIGEATETLGPAVDAVAHLADAQKKLCAFIVGHRLKLFGSVPLVLVGVQAISPNAGEVLGKLLHAWGLS